MSEFQFYKVDYSDEMNKDMKHLVNKKKFKKLPSQIKELVGEFEKGNFAGTFLTHSDEPTPYDVYKLRLPNDDTNSSKSDGYRVVYFVATEKKLVIFLMVYYKKEQETVSDVYIRGLIEGYFLNDLPEEE